MRVREKGREIVKDIERKKEKEEKEMKKKTMDEFEG